VTEIISEKSPVYAVLGILSCQVANVFVLYMDLTTVNVGTIQVTVVNGNDAECMGSRTY